MGFNSVFKVLIHIFCKCSHTCLCPY